MDKSKAAKFLRDAEDSLADESAICVELKNNGDPDTAFYVLFGKLAKGNDGITEFNIGTISLDKQKKLLSSLLATVENADRSSETAVAVDVSDMTCAVLLTGHIDSKKEWVRFNGTERGPLSPLCFYIKPDAVEMLDN